MGQKTTDDVSDPEARALARALGEALADLRRERGLSQAEAGQQIKMSGQGWGLYESGKRTGIFRPDVQRKLTSALGATLEELNLRLAGAAAPVPSPAQPVATGVSARARGFEGAMTPSRHLYRLETDDLSPWAGAGTVLEYVPGRWPRHDQGCILMMKDGSFKARLYVKSNDQEIVVRGAGALLSMERLPREAVASVSAVTARYDD